MASLDLEIKIWLERMEKKGYFNLFDDKQTAQIQDGFRKSVESIDAQGQEADKKRHEYGLGFEIHGHLGPLKWMANTGFNIDAERKISLDFSTISVQNTETGVDLTIKSKKALLDLETSLVLGRCLPDKMDIHVVRQPRMFHPDKKKGKGPSMN